MTGSELKKLLEDSPEECHKLLMKEYGRYVYAIVYNKLRCCGSREDVEECFSDIFAEIFIDFEYREAYKGDIKNYIGTVSKHKAIDFCRRLNTAKGRSVYTEEEDIRQLASDFNVDERVDSSELRRILLDKIDELGEPDSTILIQKFYYDMSSNEIAENVSMTASSVRSRCSRAMEKLRVKLAAAGITR